MVGRFCIQRIGIKVAHPPACGRWAQRAQLRRGGQWAREAGETHMTGDCSIARARKRNRDGTTCGDARCAASETALKHVRQTIEELRRYIAQSEARAELEEVDALFSVALEEVRRKLAAKDQDPPTKR